MADSSKAPKVIPRLSVEYLLCVRQEEVATLDGEAFKIGTSPKCEIRFDPEKDKDVANRHCSLIFKKGKWYVVPEPDQKVWVNEKEVGKYAAVPNGSMLFFGRPMGPGLRVFGQTETAVSRRTLARLLQRGGQQGRMVQAAAALVAAELGEQQADLRRAMTLIKQRESRKNRTLFITLALLSTLGITGIIYQGKKIQQLRTIAEDIFYQMKSLEVAMAQEESQGKETREVQMQLVELRESYDRYLEELDITSGLAGYEDKLILRMARAFGECELRMPPEFAQIVKSYIRKWRSTNRFEQAIRASIDSGYVEHIVSTMLNNKIPPHFYYLALQESDFDTAKCGPRTRFGIAKGMWQFMPATALQYGLKIGPLAQVRVADPKDERHHFEPSTAAAANYLQRIYSTEAQASGLLVLASYNYGENRVRGLIRAMEKNPRNRNFWKLLTTHNLPKQTRDYVFYIFSAAVIGEDPEYFGFDLTNPLRDIIDRYPDAMSAGTHSAL